jgi:hypothetical protein
MPEGMCQHIERWNADKVNTKALREAFAEGKRDPNPCE